MLKTTHAQEAAKLAAEQVVIDSIPPDLAARHARAQAEHKASGGCPGCGSLLLAVHEVGCPSVAGDIY